MCVNFIPILGQTETDVLVYLPSSDIANAAFTMVKPSTLWMGFKRVQNSINQPRNHSL